MHINNKPRKNPKNVVTRFAVNPIRGHWAGLSLRSALARYKVFFHDASPSPAVRLSVESTCTSFASGLCVPLQKNTRYNTKIFRM